jgi:hypothetical protein
MQDLISRLKILFIHKPLKSIILLLCLAIAVTPASAQVPSTEYQVKGAFLFNFAQFTEWPSNAFSAPNAPFVIGILGQDPYGKFLDEFVRGESINGHPVVIQRFRSVKDIDTVVHLLFVDKQFAITSEDLALLANNKNILTVSDAPGFAQRGGAINFFKENNRVRFEVNVNTAKDARVVLSSKLLRLAKICCDSSQ